MWILAFVLSCIIVAFATFVFSHNHGFNAGAEQHRKPFYATQLTAAVVDSQAKDATIKSLREHVVHLSQLIDSARMTLAGCPVSPEETPVGYHD